MSKLAHYDSIDVARTYDKERYPIGADIITGLLFIHCNQPLQDIRILDAGCGTGHYAKALIELGVGQVTLLDASQEMLNVAKEKLAVEIKSNVVDDVINVVLPNLPFDDGLFDAVMFNSVLHHIEEINDYDNFPVIEKTLMETKRTLRPKGVLIALVPSPALVKESEWFTQLLPSVTDKLLQYLPTNKQYTDMFKKCGYRVVSEMNLLTGATPSLFTNYYDLDGPLKETYRTGTSAFDIASSDEIKEIETIVRGLKTTGRLKQFVNDHDRTAELGIASLYCCISI